VAKRGRPKAETQPIVFYLNLRLYPGVDDDLIAYLQNAPRRLRVQYVLKAMRSGASPLLPQSNTVEGNDDELVFEGLWQ
jgi:hypothetical protein